MRIPDWDEEHVKALAFLEAKSPEELRNNPSLGERLSMLRKMRAARDAWEAKQASQLKRRDVSALQLLMASATERLTLEDLGKIRAILTSALTR